MVWVVSWSIVVECFVSEGTYIYVAYPDENLVDDKKKTMFAV